LRLPLPTQIPTPKPDPATLSAAVAPGGRPAVCPPGTPPSPHCSFRGPPCPWPFSTFNVPRSVMGRPCPSIQCLGPKSSILMVWLIAKKTTVPYSPRSPHVFPILRSKIHFPTAFCSNGGGSPTPPCFLLSCKHVRLSPSGAIPALVLLWV